MFGKSDHNVFVISPKNSGDSDEINVKTKFIKMVIGDVVAHLKPQKFTVLLDS